MVARVEGLDKLRQKVRKLPPEMERAIRESFETGASDMVGMAQRLAPVETGALRNSIAWRYGDPPGGSIGGFAMGSRSKAEDRISIYAGDREAFYARWVEFGAMGIPAQPFFFPAWRALRKQIKSRNTRAINKAAKKVAAGGN